MTYKEAVDRAMLNHRLSVEHYMEYKRLLEEGNSEKAMEQLNQSLLAQGAEQAWHEVAWELDDRF